MGNDDCISFSSLLAGLLLLKKNVSALDIINEINKLENVGIYVDDDNDDIEYLSCCINLNNYCSFSLKNDYDTILYDDFKVIDFLKTVAGDRVLKLLNIKEDDKNFNSSSDDKVMNSSIHNMKKKKVLSYLCSFLSL